MEGPMGGCPLRTTHCILFGPRALSGRPQKGRVSSQSLSIPGGAGGSPTSPIRNF